MDGSKKIDEYLFGKRIIKTTQKEVDIMGKRAKYYVVEEVHRGNVGYFNELGDFVGTLLVRKRNLKELIEEFADFLGVEPDDLEIDGEWGDDTIEICYTRRGDGGVWGYDWLVLRKKPRKKMISFKRLGGPWNSKDEVLEYFGYYQENEEMYEAVIRDNELVIKNKHLNVAGGLDYSGPNDGYYKGYWAGGTFVVTKVLDD